MKPFSRTPFRKNYFFAIFATFNAYYSKTKDTLATHNDLGAWGEQIARDHLIAEGYKVMERNSRVAAGEIDIIAVKGNRMIFVEVKTRSTNLDDALDAIDDKKIRRIVRAADSFLQRFSIPYEYRFDIIAVIGSPEKGHTLTHIPDAFFPPLC